MGRINITMLKIQAEKGNPIAQLNLGYAYNCGLGVKRNYDKAKEWYEKSATQGEPRAVHNLAIMLEDKGLYKQAMEKYKQAAEMGSVRSLYNIGIMYREGLGVDKDDVEADKWINEANNY